jgi:hypothetical protein
MEPATCSKFMGKVCTLPGTANSGFLKDVRDCIRLFRKFLRCPYCKMKGCERRMSIAILGYSGAVPIFLLYCIF